MEGKSKITAEQAAFAASEIEKGTIDTAEFNKLKSSYESLRADYTRKCQKLAAYERSGAASGAENGGAKAPLPAPTSPETLAADADFLERYIYPNERIRETILQRALAESKQASPRLLTGAGLAAAAESVKPKTIAEAGELAKKTLIMK